jgi:hypothetical protein
VLDDLVRVLTEHTALEEKAVLPVAEKSGWATYVDFASRHPMSYASNERIA